LNDSIQSIILPDEPGLAKKMRLIQKVNQEKIPVGVILKPIIPFVNDIENNILEIIEKSKSAGAAFIYPSFGITLSPTQRQAFMELITRELPGLRNILMDQFGLKKSWASTEQKQLKKAFVINMKKNKLPFGMKDIIGSTKETNVQLKLF
jgi:DNA repair photolyase